MLQNVLPLEPLEPLDSLESLESLIREAKEGISFDRTISRRLVHRASVTEVFLTDAIMAGSGRFLVGAQLPRNHALFRPEGAGRADFMLLVEVVRQAGIFLSHRYHDVPLGHHFIFKALSLHIADPAALGVGGGPLGIVLDVKAVTPEGPRNPRRFDARFDMVIEVGGRECARASAGVTVIDGVRYARIRQRGRAARPIGTGPAGTPAGGYGDGRGVLCPVPGTVPVPGTGAAGTREWRLHVDPAHPGYFEHPSDHVPGMLILEAFRQAALLACRPGGSVGVPGAGPEVFPDSATGALVSMDTEFRAFGELSAPVTVDATPAGDGRVRLSATQGGRVLAAGVARRTA
ncbi:ScbA/BarX family gamma-butyrolactone biosynthesis protein [Streptomyces sp. NPDC059247]|uniref:ScbA/BarX family gamma-butyrolactone biosynthesis protein n=1 Tax=Streptomyces sp. NPDC059247 TaxID=3346790 RepID=UPI003698D50B